MLKGNRIGKKLNYITPQLRNNKLLEISVTEFEEEEKKLQKKNHMILTDPRVNILDDLK